MADLAELARSAERLEGLEETTAAEREIRNRLIRECKDAGHKYGPIARAARLSIAGVQGVLTRE